MIFELIETGGFSLIGADETEEEALSDLRQPVAVNDFDDAPSISLVQLDEDDKTTAIAGGFARARSAQIPEPVTLPR